LACETRDSGSAAGTEGSSPLTTPQQLSESAQTDPLPKQDIANFHSQVPGNAAEDAQKLTEETATDVRQALQYRIEQRGIIAWQVAWLQEEEHALQADIEKRARYRPRTEL
jgi:hypothetical protein